MRVYAFLWFDVEDYITAESDAALGRMISIFEHHGLKATFKLVGEKVRSLERRGHHHILSKLQSHDVGFHTDYHSRHPSVSEYAVQCDWAGGIAEFVRREREGLETLKRTFHRLPSCYGQPGGAWAPHVYPALRQWGIPVYLDAGPWISLDGRPHRYCDVLDLLGLDSVMHIGIGGGPEQVLAQQGHLAEAVDRLRHTGGEVSLYAHECEFVTDQFWDAINYSRGRDTPPDRWQPAPLVAQEESEARYAALDAFLTFVQSMPDVQVTVASQAPSIYADRARGRVFTPQQIARVCEHMATAITHQECDGAWLSPAEVFGLAVRLLAALVRDGGWPEQIPYQYYDGPPSAPHVEIVSESLSLADVFGTCLYEAAYLDANRSVPAEIQVGRDWLSPGDFMATAGAALSRWIRGDEREAPIVRGNFAQGAYVPDHVSWDWIVFPPGFDGDPLLEVGKLQAWTLKPAVPA